jgi:hypothetical protein
MKRGIILIAMVVFVIVGLVACSRPAPPPPQTIDAPKLASSIKWLGTCAVLCSALGASALVIASRNRRK